MTPSGNNHTGSIRVLVFAMHGDFSVECIKSLVNHKINIVGILFPDSSSITGNQLPVSVKQPIMEYCDSQSIPYYPVADLGHEEIWQFIRNQLPDIIITACYPEKIPEEILDIPTSGAFNVHPSLLPEYKGPVPLFWQFYYGEENTGITLHKMEKNLDTGPVFLQKQVPFADGISGTEANILLARQCGRLVNKLLEQIRKGNVQYEAQTGRESYYSWPSIKDFTIFSDWPVKRAFNFIRGTVHWNQLYTIRSNGKETRIKRALEYQKGVRQVNSVMKKNGLILLQFKDGVLIAE